MRVREIKKELEDAGVRTSDCFEKAEMAERLVAFRRGGAEAVPMAAAPEEAAGGASETPTEEIMERCRAMRVKELRTELGTRGMSWADCLEKEELVQRLAAVLAREAAFCRSGTLPETEGPIEELGAEYDSLTVDAVLNVRAADVFRTVLDSMNVDGAVASTIVKGAVTRLLLRICEVGKVAAPDLGWLKDPLDIGVKVELGTYSEPFKPERLWEAVIREAAYGADCKRSRWRSENVDKPRVDRPATKAKTQAPKAFAASERQTDGHILRDGHKKVLAQVKAEVDQVAAALWHQMELRGLLRGLQPQAEAAARPGHQRLGGGDQAKFVGGCPCTHFRGVPFAAHRDNDRAAPSWRSHRAGQAPWRRGASIPRPIRAGEAAPSWRRREGAPLPERQSRIGSMK
ncbi:unnamed protein product [Prorocentrum cordatum]|uniref:Uncharacterized protein n=1 Tax=Prorocentrum cordatum TaxID=2364126 RepID=A0ABN9V1N5_9DINO|nr:unnamed protein product [Polarella glacialis]